jgi:hypothetical protein
MKPIQTKYNGILFRSRLEARWAMYFDLLGIEWIYELEGFDMDGVYYLPDFFLPLFNVYCEVKPYVQWDKKWDLFKSHHVLLLLFGKVHCSKVRALGSDIEFIYIPHIDSELTDGTKLSTVDISEENQQFCDEANSFRF